jgi:hypothetical protein
MPNLTSITIGGSSVAIPGAIIPGSLIPFARGGFPTFSFLTRGGALPPLPNPYLAKEIRVTINSVLRFVGDVTAAHPSYQDGLGWVISYSCRGAAARLMRFPHTDSNTGLDSSAYNLNLDDGPSYIASRAGRTIGQILSDVLTMPDNAARLTGLGVGNLTFTGGVYTLPTATSSDLAALTLIPPGAVTFGSEKFLHALLGMVQEWCPRHMLHVEPGGDIRVLSLDSFTPTTFTMGTDPIQPSELSRDCGDNYSRVVVYGQPLAVMALLKLSDGTLSEDFAWGTYTNAQAKTNWTPDQFHQPSVQDQGTCTCPDTLHVTVTSNNSSYSWSTDYWDQTAAGRHGVINLQYTVVADINQFWTARIVANTALAPPGTPSSILTIDAPLPHLNFNKYTITGLNAQDASIVYRKYKITNTALWPKITNQSTFPQPFINPGGGVTLTSTPMGAVRWPISGTGPPYNSFPMYFSYDGNGRVYFTGPTYSVAGKDPTDVWVLIPYYQGINQAVAPADVGGVPQYEGTSYTVEGISQSLYVPMPSWRDPANRANMVAYAQEVLNSVKNTYLDGSVRYMGLYEPALVPGMKVNVAGNGYTTQWEAVNLPVHEVELTWNIGGATSWSMTFHCSNRMAPLSAAFFLRPDRTFASPLESDPFMGTQAAYAQAVGSMSYTTPGAFGVQEGGALPDVGFVTPEAGRPASRTPEEQEASHHAAVEARQQRLEQQRQAEGERAAQVAMEAEQRQGLSGGLISAEGGAEVGARGQAQRARDAEQAAEITAREQARVSRAREDVASSAPRIAAEGQAQHAKELEQGREVGTREQARAARGHERGQELVEQEQQHAADRREVDQRRGEELAEEQRRRREGEET